MSDKCCSSCPPDGAVGGLGNNLKVSSACTVYFKSLQKVGFVEQIFGRFMKCSAWEGRPSLSPGSCMKRGSEDRREEKLSQKAFRLRAHSWVREGLKPVNQDLNPHCSLENRHPKEMQVQSPILERATVNEGDQMISETDLCLNGGPLNGKAQCADSKVTFWKCRASGSGEETSSSLELQIWVHDPVKQKLRRMQHKDPGKLREHQ